MGSGAAWTPGAASARLQETLFSSTWSLYHGRLVADKRNNIFSLNFPKIFIIIFEKVVCFGK